jgi:hypothetical protein
MAQVSPPEDSKAPAALYQYNPDQRITEESHVIFG